MSTEPKNCDLLLPSLNRFLLHRALFSFTYQLFVQHCVGSSGCFAIDIASLLIISGSVKGRPCRRSKPRSFILLSN